MQTAAESALLRELVDQSDVIVAVLDVQGFLVACNETVCRNAGRSRPELVGKNIVDLRVGFPVDTPGQWREIVRRVEAEKELAVETELGRADGSTYMARVTLQVQNHASGRYLLAVGHKLPDSLPLRAELEREARWRRALLDMATHDAVVAGEISQAAQFIADLVRQVLPADACDVWERGQRWPNSADPARSGLGIEKLPWFIRELESRSACDLMETGQNEAEWQAARDFVAAHGEAMLAAPIRVGGDVWGILTGSSSRVRHWTADELAFAAEAASQMAHCVLNRERNQVARKLRSSEERYRTFLEMSEESVWKVEFDAPIPLSAPVETQVDLLLHTGYMADCNDYTARFFGLQTTDQLRGARLSGLLAPLDERRRAEIRTMVVNAYHVSNVPVSHRTQGQERWLLRSSQGIVEDGKLIRLWGAARDITELKRAEEQLQLSEHRYRAFFSGTSEGIFRIDYPEPIPVDLPPEEIVNRSWNSGRVGECNQALAEMLGFEKPEDMIGHSSVDFRLLTREKWQQGLDFVLGGFRLSGTERPIRTATGSLKWFRYSALGIVSEGLLCGVWGTMSDVTERKAMESELRSLAARNTTLLEHERARVAREIHDQLGQQLTALKFEAAAWESGKRKPVVGGMTREIDAAIQAVRRIATELRPVILDEYGLAAAVEWQATEFSKRTGITSRCTIQGAEGIPDRVATPVFRILQEGLTNVARHSGATSVEIHLLRTGDRLDLELRDNGQGMPDSPTDRTPSLGLAGMRERALDAGGEVLVSSEPGQGTLLSASFPLRDGSESV